MPETVGTIATGMEGTGQSPGCLGYNALLSLHPGNKRMKTHIASEDFSWILKVLGMWGNWRILFCLFVLFLVLMVWHSWMWYCLINKEHRFPVRTLPGTSCSAISPGWDCARGEENGVLQDSVICKHWVTNGSSFLLASSWNTISTVSSSWLSLQHCQEYKWDSQLLW